MLKLVLAGTSPTAGSTTVAPGSVHADPFSISTTAGPLRVIVGDIESKVIVSKVVESVVVADEEVVDAALSNKLAVAAELQAPDIVCN